MRLYVRNMRTLIDKRAGRPAPMKGRSIPKNKRITATEIQETPVPEDTLAGWSVMADELLRPLIARVRTILKEHGIEFEEGGDTRQEIMESKTDK